MLGISAAPAVGQHNHDQHAGHGMEGMFLESDSLRAILYKEA